MNALQQLIKRHPFGFLTAEDMPELIALARLHPVLVRCGRCRFTCAAQDFAFVKESVEKNGDYLRDVSFPIGSFERAADWRPAPLPAPVRLVCNTRGQREIEYQPSPDCLDVGGVWDGTQVISDADPGL